MESYFYFDLLRVSYLEVLPKKKGVSRIYQNGIPPLGDIFVGPKGQSNWPPMNCQIWPLWAHISRKNGVQGNKFGHKISYSWMSTTCDHSYHSYTTLSGAISVMTHNDLGDKFKVKYEKYKDHNRHQEARNHMFQETIYLKHFLKKYFFWLTEDELLGSVGKSPTNTSKR